MGILKIKTASSSVVTARSARLRLGSHQLVQKRRAEPSQAVKLAQLVARATARVPFLEGRASAVRRWARSSYASSPPWPRMSHRRRRVGHFVVIGATSSCVSLASLACRSVLLCLSSSSPPSPHALHRLTLCPSSPSPARHVAIAMCPSSPSPCSLVAVALVPSSQSPWSPRHRRPGPLAPSPRVAFGPCASLATLVPVLAVFWTQWSLRVQYIMEISVRPPIQIYYPCSPLLIAILTASQPGT
jgi:hypothetical protein